MVLACKDEILNTTETSLEKVTCEKSNCLIHTISLVTIFLVLLTAISFSFCYYYTRGWIKKEYVLLY